MKQTGSIKRFILFLIVLVGVFLLTARISFAQESVSQLSNRVDVLEKEVSILNQTNNKILDTIYWALGGLITAFLAVVGLNFFQNFNLNTKKIEAIKEDIDNKLNNSANKLQERNKKDLDTLNEAVESKVKLETKTAFDQLKKKFDELEDDYKELNRANLIIQAFEHKKKNEMGYLLDLVEVLEYDISKKWDWRINGSLDLISGCLDSFNPNSSALVTLQGALDKLPPTYSIQKKRIESKMKL